MSTTELLKGAAELFPDEVVTSTRARYVEAYERLSGRSFADWPGVAAGANYPLTIFDRLWPEPFPVGSALVVGPPSGGEFRPARIWPGRSTVLPA